MSVMTIGYNVFTHKMSATSRVSGQRMHGISSFME
jgi:hypothetical protein